MDYLVVAIATLDQLLKQENVVLEFWTMRKKKLDQCHQFVLFERSAKQVRPSVCVCLYVCLSMNPFLCRSGHLSGWRLSVCLSVNLSVCVSVCLPLFWKKCVLNLYFTQKSPVLIFIHSLVPLFIDSLVGSVVQGLEWIHDTGEFYLSTHTNVGENLTETESLLKEHNEFKVTAKVSIYSRNTSSRSLPRSVFTLGIQRLQGHCQGQYLFKEQNGDFKVTAEVSISGW